MSDDRLDRIERGLEVLLQHAAQMDGRLEKLEKLVVNLAEIVQKLADVAQSHERRLDRLEGGA